MRSIIRDFAAPILALSMICLVMAGALALINHVTEPIIVEAAAERALETMRELIPDADEFVRIDTDLPDYVHAAYKAANNTGYIIVINVRGFGGQMRVMNAVDPNGGFIGSYVLAHSETISFANRVFAVRDEHEQRGESLLDVDAVSGATVTFRAYQNANRLALEVFDLIGGGANE